MDLNEAVARWRAGLPITPTQGQESAPATPPRAPSDPAAAWTGAISRMLARHGGGKASSPSKDQATGAWDKAVAKVRARHGSN